MEGIRRLSLIPGVGDQTVSLLKRLSGNETIRNIIQIEGDLSPKVFSSLVPPGLKHTGCHGVSRYRNGNLLLLKTHRT